MAEKSSNNRVFYGWINLMVVGVIGIIGGFYIASFSYFIDPLIEEFGWKYGIINLASTISIISWDFPVSSFCIFFLICGSFIWVSDSLLVQPAGWEVCWPPPL
jgi:hypothetical protein